MLSCNVFCVFNFLRNISRETICFESISGKHSSKSGLKTSGFVRDIPRKVKTTLRESDIFFSSTAPGSKIYPFGTQRRIHRIQRIRCQELWLGTSLPHAPGARMTVVYTNSLKLFGLGMESQGSGDWILGITVAREAADGNRDLGWECNIWVEKLSQLGKWQHMGNRWTWFDF